MCKITAYNEEGKTKEMECTEMLVHLQRQVEKRDSYINSIQSQIDHINDLILKTFKPHEIEH